MPDISQSVIIKKIKKYLKITQRQLSEDEKKESKKFYEEMRSAFKGGFCHGFSLVYAYMLATGKDQWWAAVLQKFSEWDGSEERLNDIHLLIGANAPDTGNNIFRRVVNYILFNQGERKTGISEISQYCFLSPGKGLFSSESGEIKHHAMASGYFSDTHFHNLITEEIFSKPGIFLISSEDHTCSIKYKEGKWIFYNPNQKNGALSFEKKALLIDELTEKFGHAVRFELASWDETLQSDFTCFTEKYQYMLKTNPADIIQKRGLSFIMHDKPTYFKNIIDLIKDDSFAKKVFFDSLTFKSDFKNTALHKILMRRPEYFHNVFNFALENKEFAIELYYDLYAIKNSNELSLIDVICSDWPDLLEPASELIEFAKKTLAEEKAESKKTDSNSDAESITSNTFSTFSSPRKRPRVESDLTQNLNFSPS